MSRFLDERLLSLKAYVPGEQPEPGKYIKLNTNEFPYMPAPEVQCVAAEATSYMNLYCDLTCKKLKNSFQKVFGYGKNNVVFTNGSDEALYFCFLAFCGRDCGVAFPDISYGFYKVYADLCGLKQDIIPLDEDFRVVPRDYFGINKTIFIANPNAPTGLRLSNGDIEAILQNNPNNIVVIDEAYTDFSGETCAPLISKYDNLVIVGTFSKSRGMAGARLGYIIASEEIVSDIEKVKFSINPYNVNNITQAVGTAVLENNEYYAEKISEICKTRDRFSKRLIEIGFLVIPSKTNFIFARHPEFDGATVSAYLKENGVLVRHFDSERIKSYVRISIGTPEQMSRVEEVLLNMVGGIK